MELARVEGNVVATAKSKRLEGYKLLLVQLLEPDLKETNKFVVALDTVGAGEGEVVIIVRGSSARQSEKLTNVPTDTSIVAIVDTLEMHGKVLFRKHHSE
ncbi:MAG: EutN/CcmL family microcompartment protein [Calditrichaeota bacterium]|nr:EutN/CcmL family microcompartment protein [Calditrichota bacterium]